MARARQARPRTRRGSGVAPAIRASATQPLFLGGRPLLDRASRVREVAIELSQRDAGILLLVGAGERHAELQQIVGRLRSLRITLVSLGKGTGRLRVSAARIIGLAQPVLGAAGQRVVRVLCDETSSRPLPQQDNQPASTNRTPRCTVRKPSRQATRLPRAAGDCRRSRHSVVRRCVGPGPGGVRVPLRSAAIPAAAAPECRAASRSPGGLGGRAGSRPAEGLASRSGPPG